MVSVGLRVVGSRLASMDFEARMLEKVAPNVKGRVSFLLLLVSVIRLRLKILERSRLDRLSMRWSEVCKSARRNNTG